jgi:hypothetical protein
MRNGKCQNVVRTVRHDGVIAFDRKRRVTFKPCARRGCMTVRMIAWVRAHGLDQSDAFLDSGPRTGIVGTHNESQAKTMAAHALGILGQRTFDLK